MRELKKQLYARDDLEHLRELIKQGAPASGNEGGVMASGFFYQ
jgi:hypothetical protein